MSIDNLLFFQSTLSKIKICFHYLIVHDGFDTLDNFMLILFVNLLLPIGTQESNDEQLVSDAHNEYSKL